MPVRGWLHQASKRLLSRSGKNQVSRQRNGTVKPSGLRLHATPCTHPGPANCITSCSDAKKKLSWLTFSSSGEFWVFDTDLRPGICWHQIRTASNSHFTPDSQIPDSRHETSEFLPKLKPGDGVESIGKWSIGETARVGPRGSLRWPPGAGVARACVLGRGQPPRTPLGTIGLRPHAESQVRGSAPARATARQA